MVNEKFQKFFVSCETGGEGLWTQVYVKACLRHEEVTEDLCFFGWWFAVRQPVRYPVPVEEVEGVSIHALPSSSLNTMEIFDRDKNRWCVFVSSGGKQEVIFDQSKLLGVPLQQVGLII